MKKTIIPFLIIATCCFAAPTPREVVRSYLLYQYGADVPEIYEICFPKDDIWMLKGAPQPSKQKLVAALEPSIKSTGVFMDTVEQDLCIVELQAGLVNPEFNLQNIYRMHHHLILQFLYFSLLQEKSELSRLVTKVENVSFGKAPKASYGDMGVYEGLLALIPVARASSPAEDAKTKTVTYRLPLGEEILVLSLVKHGSTWKIDTEKKITVPLRFFWK